MADHSKNRSLGSDAENSATKYLEKKGFLIVARNYYAGKLGEIDIVAQKDDVLHFIEVKSSRKEYFDPVYNITARKLQRIIRSAQHYLKTKRLDTAWCIDAVIIRKEDIELIENITI